MTHHALAARLAPAADPTAVLETAVRGWWPGLPDRWPVLWHETVPARFAERRLRAELHRPTGESGPAFRAVLLRYEDGGAHLVLVAHHAVLAPATLRDIAHVLLGHRPATDLTVPLGSAPPPKGPRTPRIDWATGALAAGEATGVLTVPLSGSPATAAALVLARYENRDPQDDLPPYATVLDDLGPPDPAFTHQLPYQTAPFPLTLVPRGPSLELHHRLGYVDEESARRFARHLVHVHGQLGSRPLAEIELLPRAEAERQAALADPAVKPGPGPSRIDTAFDAQAARRPDAPALTHDGTTTTYGALRERAERLAAGLRAAGVRPGDHVGIRLERGADLVATMLAVLKTGAAYVPLDPAHPEDRLDRTARDAGVRLVVRDTAPYLGAARVDRNRDQDRDRNRDQDRGRDQDRDRAAGAPQDAAYVIFTSGSTGRPKGVVVPHTHVLALLDATRDDFALTPGDTWTLFHSPAFDFSVWEIWGALLTGARLVIVDHWAARSPAEFHELLVREGVTVLSQTPSAFGPLRAADGNAKERLPVRLVVLGGEALDTRPLLGWFDRYPEHRCRLVNMYGITETTVHATAATITRREALAASRSVGRPLPGWSVSVRDDRGHVLPAGAVGEIWVGGAGLALGYLGRPELTAERFVTDPYGGGRRYRSGDLGRLRADGSLEHLGRIDRQVKVRGFRVEPDEIRAVLLEDPVVTAAAVVLSGDAFEDAAGYGWTRMWWRTVTWPTYDGGPRGCCPST